MFSRKAKYALIAAIALTEDESNQPRLIEDIARGHQLPRKFLEVILLDLRHAGILNSKKGRGGGYWLAREARFITMAEIIRAIDGPPVPFRCVAIRSDKTCEECVDSATCPIGPVMCQTRDAILGVMEKTTLSDLVESRTRMKSAVESGSWAFEI